MFLLRRRVSVFYEPQKLQEFSDEANHLRTWSEARFPSSIERNIENTYITFETTDKTDNVKKLDNFSKPFVASLTEPSRVASVGTSNYEFFKNVKATYTETVLERDIVCCSEVGE